jgi:hypothetical protein
MNIVVLKYRKKYSSLFIETIAIYSYDMSICNTDKCSNITGSSCFIFSELFYLEISMIDSKKSYPFCMKIFTFQPLSAWTD